MSSINKKTFKKYEALYNLWVFRPFTIHFFRLQLNGNLGFFFYYLEYYIYYLYLLIQHFPHLFSSSPSRSRNSRSPTAIYMQSRLLHPVQSLGFKSPRQNRMVQRNLTKSWPQAFKGPQSNSDPRRQCHRQLVTLSTQGWTSSSDTYMSRK